jgi:flagellar hook-length control protein FliK
MSAQPTAADATSTTGSTATISTIVTDAKAGSSDANATPATPASTAETGTQSGGGDSAGTGQGQGGDGRGAQSDSAAAGLARSDAPMAGLPTAPAGAATGVDSPIGVPNVVVAAPAAPTASAAPAPAAVPTPPPAAQLAHRIAPLRLDADGVHRLTVNLHPADLGPVQVVAEIRNGEINVQLTGSTDAGNDALRDALAGLKRDLEDSGFANCTLDLRQGNGQQEQARQQFGLRDEGQRGAGSSAGSGPAVPEPAPARPAGTGNNSRLDIEA